MTEVSMPQPAAFSHAVRQDSPIGADLFTSCSSTLNPTGPTPNPPFSFPLPLRTSNATHAVRERHSSDVLGGARKSARSRPNQISITAAASFNFPLSSAENTPVPNDLALPSPTKSIPISRPGGHRRGGSEFIGGDGRANGPGLMSSSPVKGAGALPSPVLAGRSSVGARRGHAHRRSGAISNHDLSTILGLSLDLPLPRHGSAPTTPSDPTGHMRFLPSGHHSASQSVPPLPASEHSSPNSSPQVTPPRMPRRDSASSTAQGRPRVGFSDTLEFIPRPLSTISSETSSSLSTIRASHSVTNSISSIMSLSSSSPSSTRRSQSLPEGLSEQPTPESRSSTAGAAFDPSPLQSAFIDRGADGRPISASGLGMALKSKHTNFSMPNQTAGQDLRCNDTTASRDRLNDSSALRPVITIPPLSTHMEALPLRAVQRGQILGDRPRSSPEAKVAKRQMKVRSWAESILSRKPRQRFDDGGQTGGENTFDPSSTPPLRPFAPMDEFSLEDVTFDDDTTCVIRDPAYNAPIPARADDSAWRAEEWPSSKSSHALSPMLDLDAEWASLPSPDSVASDEQSSGGFMSAKKRLHSSGFTGGFAGLGMHYHRRAESAPAMAPVDSQSFGPNRLGNNQAMADVFEEDEEEEDSPVRAARRESRSKARAESEAILGLGVQIVDADTNDEPLVRRSSRVLPADEIRDALQQRPKDAEDERPSSSQQKDDAVAAEYAAELNDTSEEPRSSVATKSSDDSTVTATLASIPFAVREQSSLAEFAFSPPGSYMERSEPVSAVSSPDFANLTFDRPRLGTAASSITDTTTWSSSRPADHYHSQCYSTEDVPSLTSSASTMLSGQVPRFSSTTSRSGGERSFSLSAATSMRVPRPVTPGKRSSLASLSRLVGSSYGEKSKLSIESRAQQDESDKSDKKKGNRISRLMRFWKSKDKVAT